MASQLQGPRRLDRVLSTIAKVMCYVSVAALILAMGVVGTDIALRTLFNRPILGATDIVALLFAVMLFFALPATFLGRQHIVVDIVDLVASARLVRVLVAVSSVLGVVLLLVMTWEIASPVSYMYETGEATLNIELPKWIAGAFSFAGLLISALAEGVVALSNIRKVGWDAAREEGSTHDQ